MLFLILSCFLGVFVFFFFFQAEDGIRDDLVTGVQTCALPISKQEDNLLTEITVAAFSLFVGSGLIYSLDRKSTRLNSSHQIISYAVFCLKKKKHTSELQSPDHLVCRLLLEKKKEQ